MLCAASEWRSRPRPLAGTMTDWGVVPRRRPSSQSDGGHADAHAHQHRAVRREAPGSLASSADPPPRCQARVPFLPFVIAVVLAVVLWLSAYSGGADVLVLAAIICVPAAGALAGIGVWAVWPGDRDSVTRGGDAGRARRTLCDVRLAVRCVLVVVLGAGWSGAPVSAGPLGPAVISRRRPTPRQSRQQALPYRRAPPGRSS